MKVSITSNLHQASAMLDRFARQTRFAQVLALTRTARIIQERQVHEMRDVFDRPTPYTLSGTYLRPATLARPESEVGLKNFAGKGIPASKYLSAQIRGGERGEKRFERALRYAGLLPYGFIAVPASGAQTDAFGNMSRGQIVQILSYLQAFSEVGYRANMTQKRKASLGRGGRSRRGMAYFVAPPGGHLHFGVWQRIHTAWGSAVKPVLLFVRRAQYEAVYDFDYVARITADRELPAQLTIALDDAWRTARR